MMKAHSLCLDRDWLEEPRSYYLYRGSEEVSEVYILKSEIEERPPQEIRLLLACEPVSVLQGKAYELELRNDMLNKVQSKYIYRSTEKRGSSQIIGGVYIARSLLGAKAPDMIHASLEW